MKALVSATDFFVAVCEDATSAVEFHSDVRYKAADEQELISQVLDGQSDSLLLLAFVENKAVGQSLSKAMYGYFAESIHQPKDVYTQYSISFVDEGSSSKDIIQYRCERFGDIDAVIEAEDGANTSSCICATHVAPSHSGFNFLEKRLIVVTCTEPDYSVEGLINLTDSTAAIIGCHVSSIGLYIPRQSKRSAMSLSKLVERVPLYKASVTCRSVGRAERVPTRTRLQDVRAWSHMIGERRHFAPVTPGPYFISLNPQLTVGEKLAHCILDGTTYIVGDATNASPLDFNVMPLVDDCDEKHRSIYSPHCRLRREGNTVWLKPECGMSYINGNLAAEEVQLQGNDRIILGKQLAFRFVLVGETTPRVAESRILDWELCSQEFRHETESRIATSTIVELERTNSELKLRCDDLSKKLAHIHGNSWIILSNPPTHYKGPLLWPLDLRKRHSQITIGPQGDVTLPFLTNTAVVKNTLDGLVFKCDNVSIPLSHGSRFSMGSCTLALSIDRDTSPAKVRDDNHVPSTVAPYKEAVLAMQSSFFSLQWSVGALFDFVFPPKSRRFQAWEDPYAAYRSSLYSTEILESDAVLATDVVSFNEQLTAAIRLIGSGLAKESESSQIRPAAAMTATPRRSDAGSFLQRTEFLKNVLEKKELSAVVLNRLHEEIGGILQDSCFGHVDPTVSEDSQNILNDKLKEVDHPSSFEKELNHLKGVCLISSPNVMRRISGTVDLLSMSKHPKKLWEKHVHHASTLGTFFTDKKLEDDEQLREIFLFIVDAVISTDFCLRYHLISSNDKEATRLHMANWQTWADRCVKVVESEVPRLRNTWKHEAAVQRKLTPNVRRTTGKERSSISVSSKPTSRSASALRKTSTPRVAAGGTASRVATDATSQSPRTPSFSPKASLSVSTASSWRKASAASGNNSSRCTGKSLQRNASIGMLDRSSTRRSPSTSFSSTQKPSTTSTQDRTTTRRTKTKGIK